VARPPAPEDHTTLWWLIGEVTMSKVMTAWMMGLAIGLFPSLAAAGVCSLEVSPLTVELRMDPGHTYTETITVKNMGDGPEHIRAYCQDWTLKPDGVVVFVSAGRLPGSASPWVHLLPAEFDLEPGEIQRIRYTIRLPAGTSGEARTSIMFEAGAREISAPGAPSRLVPRVGTILYVQAGPSPPERARAVSLEIDRTGGMLTVENLGTAHLRFTAQIEVRDGRGALARRCRLNPFVVLPAPFNGHRARLGPDILEGLSAGSYTITAILDYGGEALLGARVEIELGPEPPIEIASEK